MGHSLGQKVSQTFWFARLKVKSIFVSPLKVRFFSRRLLIALHSNVAKPGERKDIRHIPTLIACVNCCSKIYLAYLSAVKFGLDTSRKMA